MQSILGAIEVTTLFKSNQKSQIETGLLIVESDF